MPRQIKGRPVIFACLVIVLGAVGGAITKQFLDEPAPKAVSLNYTLDIGRTLRGQPIVRKFAIRNDGNAPLVLAVKSTSCACTGASLEKSSLAPAESTNLITEVSSVAAHSWDVVVRLSTNDPRSPEIVYQLTGVTYELLSVHPPALSSSVIRSGDLPKKFTVALSAATDEFSMDEIKASTTDDFLNPKIVQSAKNKKESTLTVEVLGNAPIGQVLRNIKLEVPRLNYSLDIPLSLEIYGEIAVQPRNVFISKASLGDKFTQDIQFDGAGANAVVEFLDGRNGTLSPFNAKIVANEAKENSRKVSMEFSIVDDSRPISRSLHFLLRDSTHKEAVRVEIPITIVPGAHPVK